MAGGAESFLPCLRRVSVMLDARKAEDESRKIGTRPEKLLI
jgi:hypothetical protein